MRHLTCHLQEVPQDLPSLSQISSMTPVWKSTRGDRGSTSNLQPLLPTHTGWYVSMLMSSLGLRAPINSQPYGFQLWLLADVCPTHCSIWRTRELVSPFGSFGDFLSDFDYLSTSGWLVFSQRWSYGPMWQLFINQSDLSCLQCQQSLIGWLPLFTCKVCAHIGLTLWTFFMSNDYILHSNVLR